MSWEQIEKWIGSGERPIEGAELDMFRHRSLADRVAKTVGVDGRSVALLGPFGAGKSSILNAVRARLNESRSTVVVASFDAWAVPEPHDVPRLALSRLVAALDDYVDTIELRGVPATYQKLAAAEPSGRLAAAFAWEVGSDSIAELERLNPFLEVLDARFVLFVEDVERAGKDFDTRHLARLLWALRRVKRCSFVIAVEPTSTRLDFPKICDAIELVPPLDVARVADILTIAYAHWSTQYSDIDPSTSPRRSDKLKLEYATQGGMLDHMRRTGRNTPLDALVSLLQTPRSLKHVIRRVDETWQKLHGEVALDDVVIVSALRHGAQPAYEFLLADIDPARSEPSDVLKRTMSVKEDWQTLISGLSNRKAVQMLVDLTGIKQLMTGSWTSDLVSPQGVHLSEPVDYFRRIVAGELAPGEIRDQEVLADIDRWNADAGGALVGKLVGCTDADDQYVSVWEHFALRHSVDQLVRLTDEVVGALLHRDSALADAAHPTVLALWRRCNRTIQPNERAEWLRELIGRAVPVSLRMVNGLYYYWAGQQGIVNGDSRLALRESIAQAFRSEVRTSADLARVLPKDHRPFEIVRFITQTGSNPTPAAFAEWSDTLPAVLIDGARHQPDVLLPELATLSGDHESSIMAPGADGPPSFADRYRIDRDRFIALFRDRTNQALRVMADYKGGDPYAARAVEDARTWLTDREVTVPGAPGG